MSRLTIRQSECHQRYRVCRSDLNGYGIMHGGRLLTLCDETAYLAARRHAGGACLTKAVHQARFHRGIGEGERIDIRASLGLTGHSSLWVSVEIGHRRQIIMDAVFVFVAIDAEQRPRRVPPFTPAGETEQRLYRRMRRLRDSVISGDPS